MAQPDDNEDGRLATRASLLARLQGREASTAWQRGWREFFDAYHPVLYQYACRQGLSESDAEDVVQEIVVGVAGRLPAFRYEPQRCSFKTWLFRIARNKISDHHRRRFRQEREFPLAAPEATTLEVVVDGGTLSPDAAWDAEYEASLRRTALARVTRRVKPMTMRLYLHHVVDGHDVRASVEHFRDSGVTAAAVYVARHRVQALLDKELARLRRGESVL